MKEWIAPVFAGGTFVAVGLLAMLPSSTSEPCATGSESAVLIPYDMRPSALVSYLERGAVDLGTPGRDDTYGAGRLDIWAAFVVAFGDVNDDRRIDLSDALGVLEHFGEPTQPVYYRHDVDGQGGVDLTDALLVLENFGVEACT